MIMQLLEQDELQKYNADIQEDIKARLVSEEEGTTPEQLFTEWSLSLLADAGETENFRVSYDEKISKRGVEHRVSGYSLYENYETLDLFVTLYFENDEIQNITKADAEKALDKLSRFFKNAVYKKYADEIEESSQIFDLAHTLSNVSEVKEFLSRVNMFLVTNGELKSDIKFSETIQGYSIFYRAIDINYLFNLSAKSRIPIEINFAEAGFQLPCIVNDTENDDYQSYLAIMPGSALVDIYEKYGARLLEQNVRSFLQFTGKYNKGIRNTILNESHMFLAFNNGIAATAEEIELVDLPNNKGQGIGLVRDFQIVNGGQTTASIYHTWKKNKNIDITKLFVQVKLTIIKNKTNFSAIVGRIAEYSNTQNKVSTSDLSSNKENHVILEKLSRTIWAPPSKDQVQQTRWFFERARGQYKNARLREGFTLSRRKSFDIKSPRSQVIDKESIAKYINVWNEVYKGKNQIIGPHIVVRGNQKNYVEFLCHNFKDKPDNVFFEDLVAKAIIFKTAEKIYGVKPNALGDMRYITVPYTIGWLGYKLNYKLDLYKIWKRQRLSDNLKVILREVMIKVEDFIKRNAPGSLYGEWAKKEDCWTMIKSEDLGVDLNILGDDLENALSLRRRSKSDDIEKELIRSEMQLIEAIPINRWNEISKMGKHIRNLSQYLIDSAINIMSTLKLGKELTDIQRKNALELIDVIVNKVPDFFDEPYSEDTIQEIKHDSVKISVELLKKMMTWDIKANVLAKNELQYVSDFVYGLKKLNAFHEKNLERYLHKLLNAGFSGKE